MIEVRCPTEADTVALGARLAPLVRAGDVIVLCGGLGAGKTRFVGGLADGLGVEEQVVSPSFILARRYDTGFLPLIHADVYRLDTINEFDDLDLLDTAADGVLVIEWGDAVEPVLPEDHLRVEFEVEEDQTRILRLVPSGSWESRDLGEVT